MAAYKQHQYNMNNIVKIMLKRGLVTDLARVAHSLDLSSPNVSATVNAVLKPLETLSRIVNQPSPIATARYDNKKKFAEEFILFNPAQLSKCLCFKQTIVDRLFFMKEVTTLYQIDRAIQWGSEIMNRLGIEILKIVSVANGLDFE